MSSYNDLETQDTFDIYTLYTQLLSYNDSFFMPNKPHLTNKTILHHNILRHPYNNHKHKHQTEMNISSLTNIPLYDFMRKTWMILVKVRINSSLLTSMTKAMTRVMAGQHHVHCNITNLGRCPVDLNLDHLPHYIDHTISFNNKIMYNN